MTATVHFAITTISRFAAEHDRIEVLDAAKTAVVSLTSWDGQNADTDVQRMLRSTTREFAASFAGDRDEFVRGLRDSKTKIAGTVLAVGLVNYSADHATVAAAVRTDAGAPNAATPPTNYRLELTMEKQSGEWRVSGVESAE
jgi:Mce-associated membrane protein